MIETSALNSMLLFIVVIIVLAVSIFQLKRSNANYQAPLSAESIVSLLWRNGTSSSVKGPWIIFHHLDQEYTINISKLPVLIVIKQTSLEGFQENTVVLREVAQAVSLDTVLATVQIEGATAKRAVIQLNAIETCVGAFAQRLSIYLDIIDETEKRFFDEIERRKINN